MINSGDHRSRLARAPPAGYTAALPPADPNWKERNDELEGQGEDRAYRFVDAAMICAEPSGKSATSTMRLLNVHAGCAVGGNLLGNPSIITAAGHVLGSAHAAPTREAGGGDEGE